MAVIKEWKCLAHGPFDSAEEVCPHGCTTVVREFRTAPGGRSEKTKTSDAALERLASQYNLSNMSNKNGSIGGSRTHKDEMAPVWGELPKGNIFQPGKGEVQADGAQGGATAALKNMGIMPGNAGGELSFNDIAKTLPRLRPNVVGSFGDGKALDTAIGKTP